MLSCLFCELFFNRFQDNLFRSIINKFCKLLVETNCNSLYKQLEWTRLLINWKLSSKWKKLETLYCNVKPGLLILTTSTRKINLRCILVFLFTFDSIRKLFQTGVILKRLVKFENEQNQNRVKVFKPSCWPPGNKDWPICFQSDTIYWWVVSCSKKCLEHLIWMLMKINNLLGFKLELFPVLLSKSNKNVWSHNEQDYLERIQICDVRVK